MTGESTDEMKIIYDINHNNSKLSSSPIPVSSTQEIVNDFTGEFVTVGSTSAVFVVPELKATSVPIRSLFRPSGLCRSVDGDLHMYRSDDDSNEETTYTSDMFIERATFGGAARDAEDAEFSTGWDSLARDRFVARLGIRSVWEYDAKESNVPSSAISSSMLYDTPMNWSDYEDSWPAVFMNIKPRPAASRERVVGVPLKTSTPRPESHFVHLNESTPSGKANRLPRAAKLVLDATSDEQSGAPEALLMDISALTYTSDGAKRVADSLWKQMLEKNEGKWNRVLKSLAVLLYLLQNGSDEIVASAKEHLVQLSSLANDFYAFDNNGDDYGKYVRRSARTALFYLTNDDKLEEERVKARKEHEKENSSDLAHSCVHAAASVRSEQCVTACSPSMQEEEIEKLGGSPYAMDCKKSMRTDPFSDIDAFGWFHSMKSETKAATGNKQTSGIVHPSSASVTSSNGSIDVPAATTTIVTEYETADFTSKRLADDRAGEEVKEEINL